MIRRDVVQGPHLAGPLLRPSVAEGSGDPGDAGKVAARVHRGFGSQFFTNNGKYLVAGQLYWWKLVEHHCCLWELISVLSKAVSVAYFLM